MASANELDLPPLGHRYAPVAAASICIVLARVNRQSSFCPGEGCLASTLRTSTCARRNSPRVWSTTGPAPAGAVPVPLPRSAEDVVHELRALLRVAGLSGPYLLVGHSLGGLYARRFAQLHPADIAALLLLDPAHEDYGPGGEPEIARRAAEAWKSKPMPELGPEQVQGFRPIFEGMYKEWPPEIREPLIERHSRSGSGARRNARSQQRGSALQRKWEHGQTQAPRHAR